MPSVHVWHALKAAHNRKKEKVKKKTHRKWSRSDRKNTCPSSRQHAPPWHSESQKKRELRKRKTEKTTHTHTTFRWTFFWCVCYIIYAKVLWFSHKRGACEDVRFFSPRLILPILYGTHPQCAVLHFLASGSGRIWFRRSVKKTFAYWCAGQHTRKCTIETTIFFCL